MVLCSNDTMENTALWTKLVRTRLHRKETLAVSESEPQGALGLADVPLIDISEVTTTQCTFSHASFVYLSSLLSWHTYQYKILSRSAMRELLMIHQLSQRDMFTSTQQLSGKTALHMGTCRS